MSKLDFTSGLFRDPESVRAFADDPVQALRDAGVEATPEEIRGLMPLVAESMPPDHPLHDAARSADPQGALQNLAAGEGVTPGDDAARHYYQLQPGDTVESGVAGQTIVHPDGTSVLVENNDIILPEDAKVHVLQPGDTVVPGINGQVIQHADGSITDAGTDSYIVHEDEVYDPGPSTGGLDPRVTTTPEDLGDGLDPYTDDTTTVTDDQFDNTTVVDPPSAPQWDITG